MEKESRVFDIKKSNQIKNNFTGVMDTDMQASFNRSKWNSAISLQQLFLGRSHLILGDYLV